MGKATMPAQEQEPPGTEARIGVRVNGVAPGPVWTPLIPASFPAEEVAEFGADDPIGRPAQPDEIAPTYVYLACGDSAVMTGQVQHPNGGEIVGRDAPNVPATTNARRGNARPWRAASGRAGASCATTASR